MKIKILKYDPEWIRKYSEIRKVLESAFRSISPYIEHVGSTSVPGLDSKPVIDILVGVKNMEEADQMIPGMKKLGYEYVSEYEAVIPERRFFKKKDAVHIHTVVLGSEFWCKQILFRDYLRQNKNVMDVYSEFKNELSNKDWMNSNEYAFAKTDFVRRILKEAEIYFSSKG